MPTETVFLLTNLKKQIFTLQQIFKKASSTSYSVCLHTWTMKRRLSIHQQYVTILDVT